MLLVWVTAAFLVSHLFYFLWNKRKSLLAAAQPVYKSFKWKLTKNFHSEGCFFFPILSWQLKSKYSKLDILEESIFLLVY